MQTLTAGTWPSPVTARSMVGGAVAISEVIPDGDDIWWAEGRPDDGGRVTVVRWRDGSVVDVTPVGSNVRTSVHEYGGGAWWVDRGAVYYVEFDDQRLRRLEPGGEPLLLTPEPSVARGLRYADGRVTPDGDWFVCVRENHESSDRREAVNEIVAIATDGSMRIEVIATGADFYASPRVSPDGAAIVWIQWMHPNMPWDVTELWHAELAGGWYHEASTNTLSVLLASESPCPPFAASASQDTAPKRKSSSSDSAPPKSKTTQGAPVKERFCCIHNTSNHSTEDCSIIARIRACHSKDKGASSSQSGEASRASKNDKG